MTIETLRTLGYEKEVIERIMLDRKDVVEKILKATRNKKRFNRMLPVINSKEAKRGVAFALPRNERSLHIYRPYWDKQETPVTLYRALTLQKLSDFSTQTRSEVFLGRRRLVYTIEMNMTDIGGLSGALER